MDIGLSSPAQGGSDLVEQIFGPGGVAGNVGAVAPLEVVQAILLSLVLMLVIGMVYQRTHRGSRYSQDYVHMLVMLGVLVSVVIMGIGGDAARAFGIFAAFSIIRFRRSLPEARDIAFIFFAMAVGLAIGAGEYALAVLTTVLVCLIIVVVARLDLFAPQRHSHLLRVRVGNDMDHATVFNTPFERFLARHRLLAVESVQGGLLTELRYAVELRPGGDPLEFVSAIQLCNGNNRVILQSVDASGEANGQEG